MTCEHSDLFIKQSSVSSHVVVEHNILFDPTADVFILAVKWDSLRERSGIQRSRQ